MDRYPPDRYQQFQQVAPYPPGSAIDKSSTTAPRQLPLDATAGPSTLPPDPYSYMAAAPPDLDSTASLVGAPPMHVLQQPVLTVPANLQPVPQMGSPEGSKSKPKRRRNKHACDQCRSKKGKCDGVLPCASCANSGLSCTYSTPKKRGIPSGYLEKLERTNDRLLNIIGLLVKSMEDGEDHVRRLVREYDGDHDGESGSSTGPTGVSAASHGTRALSDSAPSPEAAAPRSALSDEFLSSLNIPIFNYMSTHKHAAGGFGSGPTGSGGQGSALGAWSKLPKHDATADSASDEVAEFGPSSGFDTSFIASFERLQLTQPTFNVESWSRLIRPFEIRECLEYYFSYFHYLFPLVDKDALSQLASNTSTEDSTVRRNSQTCLLWSAVIMGCHYLKPEQARSNAAQQIYNLSVSTLECKHTVESVQALFIQSFYYIARGFWGNAWMVAGNAVRISIELGIQIHSVKLPEYSRLAWKHCCIMDTFISGRMGRIPQIRVSDYFDIDEEITPKEYEMWQSVPINGQSYSLPSRVVSTFNHVSKLSRLSNAIITETNKPDFPDYSTPEQTSSFLASSAQQLTNWFDDIPKHLNAHAYLTIQNRPPDRITPGEAQLFLGYVTVMSILLISGTDPRYCNTGDELYSICYNASVAYGNLTPPTFEYFYAISTAAVLKHFLESKEYLSGQIRLASYLPFTWLLSKVHESSRTWDGLSVAYDYFESFLKNEAAALKDGNGITPYMPPLTISSLQNILRYPNFEGN